MFGFEMADKARAFSTVGIITTIRSCCGTIREKNLDADVVVDSGDDGAPAPGLH